MIPQVFISYSHIDSSVADDLVHALDNAGVMYFLDVKDIVWGESITSKINDAVHKSDAIIVILSPASLKSAWVPFELGGAIALGKKLLPFLTHPSLDLPAYLRDIRTAQSIEEVIQFLGYLKSERAHEPRDRSKQPAEIQLSPEAHNMILEMSKDDHGLLLYVQTFDGTSFQTRGQNLCPDQSPETVAKWKAALDSLIGEDFVEQRGQKGEVFALTSLGFEIANRLKANCSRYKS